MESKLITELRGLIEDVNPNEIAAHIADGTLFAWTQTWKMKAHMVVGFLNMTLSRHEESECERCEDGVYFDSEYGEMEGYNFCPDCGANLKNDTK